MNLRILLTNDDGIGAPGIQALWQSLSRIAEVIVVAPDIERSATSQAITVHHPIRVDQYCIDEPPICAWRVGGTPTDCVKIAIEALMADRPDIVVSGINLGSNLGTDVLYSGTVSAAIEGSLFGITSIAVSLDTWQAPDFSPAAHYTAELVQMLEHKKLPPGTLLNVNVPAISANQIAGIAITKLGVRQYANTFERRQDPRGRLYYWMGGELVDNDNDPDTDIVAVKNNKISITPIHFDLTNHDLIKSLNEWNIDKIGL